MARFERVCPECGTSNAYDKTQCAKCRAPLTGAPASNTPPTPILSRKGAAKLAWRATKFLTVMGATLAWRGAQRGMVACVPRQPAAARAARCGAAACLVLRQLQARRPHDAWWRRRHTAGSVDGGLPAAAMEHRLSLQYQRPDDLLAMPGHRALRTLRATVGAVARVAAAAACQRCRILR